MRLREIEPGDAAAIGAIVDDPEVRRYFPPPAGVGSERFARFVAFSREARAAGRAACFVAVPAGASEPAGFFQLMRVRGGLLPVWGLGFVLARDRWGTGLFVECADLVLEFAFETMRLWSVHVWCAVDNERAAAAVRKLAPARSRVIRQTREPGGLLGDFIVFTITRRARARARRQTGG